MDRTGIGARLIIIIYYRLPGTKLKKILEISKNEYV